MNDPNKYKHRLVACTGMGGMHLSDQMKCIIQAKETYPEEPPNLFVEF